MAIDYETLTNEEIESMRKNMLREVEQNHLDQSLRLERAKAINDPQQVAQFEKVVTELEAQHGRLIELFSGNKKTKS